VAISINYKEITTHPSGARNDIEMMTFSFLLVMFGYIDLLKNIFLRAILAANVSAEKRKSYRLKCLLPAEVLKAGGNKMFIDKGTIHDFSRDGLKLTINFKLNPGSQMEMKLFLPEQKLSTSLSGKIMWSRCSGNKIEAGLKINNMDQKAKEEVLNWVFPDWLKKERKTEQK
jgi:hypothetical protein